MKNWLIPLLVLSAGTLFAQVSGANELKNMSAGVRGAESNVKGSIGDVNQRAQGVFKELGINRTGTKIENSGTEQTLIGKMGSTDVTVVMKQEAQNQTHVDVIAKDSALKWNKSVANNVLSKIIQQG